MIPGTRSPARRRIEEVAATPVPAPRAVFVADLEHRLTALMHSAVDGDVLPELELAPPAPVRARVRPPIVAGMAVLLLAVAVVGVVSRASSRPVHQVRLANGAAAATTAAPAQDPSSSPADTALPAPRVGGPTAGTRAAPPPTTPPPVGAAPSTSETPRESVDGFGLSAAGTPARVDLSWDRYDGSDFAAYLVLRAEQPDEVDHPDATGRSAILARIENRDLLRHHDFPKLGSSPRYRVVVLDRTGSVVARSTVASPWEGFETSVTNGWLVPYVATS